MRNDLPQLLTVVEAAERLRISRSKIYEPMAEGELASVRIGHSRRIAVTDLAEFVAQRVEGPPKARSG